MSVEKGVPLDYSLWGMRDVRGKQPRAVRGRGKARGQARGHGRSHLEPGSRGAQIQREKLWVPWNGLIVIGKRMELLGRNTQKPRMWGPKLDSESWRLDGVEKRVLKEKSGQSQERMDVKLLPNVAGASQASAGLGKNSPREMWGKQEIRGKIGAESESAGTTAGSRMGSGFKDRLKVTGVRTSGEDLRSRGYTLGQNEEELRSGGEKLRSSRERLRSSGEKLRSSRERLRSSGEKLRSSGEKLSLSGGKLSLTGEKLGSSGENQGSRGEKLGASGEDLRSTGDKLQSSAEKLGPSGEKLEDSGMGSINEESIERLIEVTGAEMEIPVERVEGNDELEGAKEAGVEEDVLDGVNDIADESVSVEEKEVIGEGSGEGGR
ncbi:uncharacterized protein LOC125146701 [Prionailurus viverrinus]|uniref:uncharacterized protein LOC125146701 n=1 Tax=Prionailurus viverrinus TaxID=61388 RepID=UPI001FF224A3|nr:uncharacterized protein LOC125146701 [Prionailurus viverrinus]XP_047679407.1 uncharacterized protein LOC125146701 [Prionailurus viverrinus]XP_047679408.1 uncharacterized protein LOC125146701 [Prionailurus viverrinus]XP_047679409.1 uncharacterized protein LOC125146701 [Prionailurus viverrinus]XP_047679410.1 uncharacterized protein LOC125146701 [Prionailurus viverrinus]XP_047679411.1 uncharacterized protein LOC125146701 [Prionailurus viverrinus]XP_047679412.1 uncharacterized protein LOC12514